MLGSGTTQWAPGRLGTGTERRPREWRGPGAGGSGDRDGPTWPLEGWPSFLRLEGPRDKAPGGKPVSRGREQAAHFPSLLGWAFGSHDASEPPASVPLCNTDVSEGDCGEEGGEGESPGLGLPTERLLVVAMETHISIIGTKQARCWATGVQVQQTLQYR